MLETTLHPSYRNRGFPFCFSLAARKNRPGSGRPQQPRQPGRHDHKSRSFLQMGEGTDTLCLISPSWKGNGLDPGGTGIDQFRGPSVSKGVIIPILPTTRVLFFCESLGMGDYPNHTEIGLTEVHANVERLLDMAVTLGS